MHIDVPTKAVCFFGLINQGNKMANSQNGPKMGLDTIKEYNTAVSLIKFGARTRLLLSLTGITRWQIISLVEELVGESPNGGPDVNSPGWYERVPVRMIHVAVFNNIYKRISNGYQNPEKANAQILLESYKNYLYLM